MKGRYGCVRGCAGFIAKMDAAFFIEGYMS
jgi:hypothetical protein